MFKKLLTILTLLSLTSSSRAQYITNPVLAGFYPDPSICRVGPDYYIVNSSFAYYPGLPVFHSQDLVNWELIGQAMDRPGQLNLQGAGVSRGLFAPAISYHDGKYYIICTLIDKLGNFVITADDPKGPWSDPVTLPQLDGIDPSLFFDENKAYIVYNSVPPGNKSLYDGHRTIRMIGFDAAMLKVTGEEKILINGGTDISKKPVWIEGPHLLKKDGWYYLICAEGGTGYNHSEVVFRSASLKEDFVSYANNPILTQRNLDPNRANPITTTGHAELVETPEGKWYAVFLGCRPYEGDYYNTGRETFMAPVEWKDGWPLINPGFAEVQYRYPIKAKRDKHFPAFWSNPGFAAPAWDHDFTDLFRFPHLDRRYSFLRTLSSVWYHIYPGKKKLALEVRPETCSGTDNPSFIGFRQPHLKGFASTTISFKAKAANEKAGLLTFQSEHHFYLLCVSTKEGQPVVELYKSTTGAPEMIATNPLNSTTAVQLKIVADGPLYSFYFSEHKDKWQLLKDGVDGKFLSTKEAGGFVGSMYAMYATSNGGASVNEAYFSRFECKSEDSP